VAQGPRLGFDPAGEGSFGQALAQQLGDARVDLVGERRGGGDALDLPGRLDRPLGHEQRADVDEASARELALVAAKELDRQHVELEPHDVGRTATPFGDELAEAPQAGQLRDRQRRLLARAGDRLSGEQHRLVVGGHQKLRLLDRAGKVVEVGVLHDDGGVDALFAQRRLKGREPAFDLGGRHGHRARLDERRFGG
jgi:hypothetical protein